MKLRRTLGLVTGAILLLGATHALARNVWWQYEREMQTPINDPPDAELPAEFAFARLRYYSPLDRYQRARWGTDANKSERQFIIALRRLSRIDAKSIEQIVDIDTDDIYDWPFLYAVAAGDWVLSDAQAERLGNYLRRGGFLVVDDLHNDQEWGDFMYGIEQALPELFERRSGRLEEEIPDDDAIFHVVHDVHERVQISGWNIVSGRPYERGGYVPHWYAVRDSGGRIVVAGWHNQDLGDAWEWADNPLYPENLASLAFRFGVNYLTYSMTH